MTVDEAWADAHCPCHGEPWFLNGRKRRCRAKGRARGIRHYTKRRTNGLCVNCGTQADRGRSHCKACLARKYANAKRLSLHRLLRSDRMVARTVFAGNEKALKIIELLHGAGTTEGERKAAEVALINLIPKEGMRRWQQEQTISSEMPSTQRGTKSRPSLASSKGE